MELTYSTSFSILHKCQHYIIIIRGCGFVTVYFLTMIYMTLDKFFDIYLNIKYHVYWNEYQTKNLLTFTWLITISSAASASIWYHFTGVNMHETLDLYVYPTFDMLFLIIAISTYGFIFHKYKRSRLPPVHLRRRTSIVGCVQTVKVFKQSRFYIPLLLTATFIVFMVIPEFVNLSIVASEGEYDNDIRSCLRIMWTMSYLVDALIYIWMKASVWKLLKRKLRWRTDQRLLSRATMTTIISADETQF